MVEISRSVPVQSKRLFDGKIAICPGLVKKNVLTD